jgi:hypothetical protein
MTQCFTIDSNSRFFDQIGFYFANNITSDIINKDQKDENLTIINDDLSEISLSINNFIRSRKNYVYRNRGRNMKQKEPEFKLHPKLSSVLNSIIKCKYKDFEYEIKIELFGDNPYACNESIRTFQVIKVYYEDLNKLLDFWKSINLYYIKYYKDSEENDNTYVLYINDENYWEHLGSKNKRFIENIFLPKKQKSLIEDDLGNFLSEETKERYLELGINYKRVYLLEGIPGSGKTSLITALASKYDLDIGIFTFDTKTTDAVFTKMVKNLPENCALLLEDMDGLFQARKEGDILKNGVTMSGILNTLDGVGTRTGLVCFITTNHKGHLDPALIRPGRVDFIMTFESIKKKEILQMFKLFTKKTFVMGKDLEFYEKFKELSIEISASLLQQYLFKYLDDVEEAIANTDDIKDMLDKSTIRAAKDMYT